MSRRRENNLARQQRETAPCPIISVGNLTTGGTGKTPTVQWLVRQLQRFGWKVGVAARGYGGTHSERGNLVSDGQKTLLTAVEAGDEAVLHARNLPGAIVAIAQNRHLAVDLCVQHGAQVVVLDDGFQFWSLPRVFDLVLLDAKRPWGNGRLLPLGRLREERAALARASAILLTRADRPTMEELDYNRREIRLWTKVPIFEAFHAPLDVRDEKSGARLPLTSLKNQDVRAFAGLADNTQFYKLVRELTGRPVDTPLRERGDHHKWKKRDLYQWTSGRIGGTPLITTEKDAVKIDHSWVNEQLLSLRIALRLRDGEDDLMELISQSLRDYPSPRQENAFD
ncbi:tetraacyldisaccharide 4'-kinase [Abditibacteriota bacterium]|nr:tetraacyldisaccharide 4'-kinase [Abditibacteriota bacterium]